MMPTANFPGHVLRPMRRPAGILLLPLLLALFLTPARGDAPGAPGPGYRQMARLESDLCGALEAKRRRWVTPELRYLEQVRLPCLAAAPAPEDGPAAPVRVSAGLVDFLDRLAQARAHDEVERGFYVRYTKRLGEDSRRSPVPDFAILLPKDASNLQTQNRQATFFNQMAGGLMAVELAHQYLGHYRKHAAALNLPAALPRPINELISESEWRVAVQRGAENALACGLATDGLRAVFDCFESMSPRPAWAAYFIHPEANARRINAELVKTERDFFAMDQRPQPLTGSGRLEGR